MRARIVLVVLLGGIAPLGLWGWWTLSTAREDGEAVLRARMEASLEELAQGLGIRWIEVRSALADMAESPEVRTWLRDGDPFVAEPSGVDEWPAVPGRLTDRVVEVAVRDGSGRLLRTLRRPGSAGGVTVLPAVRVPVWGQSGARIGEMALRLESETLLPAGIVSAPVSGSVFAIIGADEADAVLPPAMTTELLAEPRFVWGGEEWVTARRAVADPELVLVMASPLTPFVTPLERAGARGLVGLALVSLLGVGVALLLSGRLVAPLASLASAADRVSSGALDVRVDPRGPGDVARVARAFNQMTSSLRATLATLARQERLAAVGEFAASLAHEIRNPLTSVRLDLERAVERLEPGTGEARLVGRGLAEVERLADSVSGTLRLARGGRVDGRAVDVHAVVRSAMERAAPRFREKGVELVAPDGRAARRQDRRPIGVSLRHSGLPGPTHTTREHNESPSPGHEGEGPDGEVGGDEEVGHSARLVGDPRGIEQVLVNLLENAAAACEAGARAGIRVVPDDRGLTLEVWDEGRGMDAEECGRATEVLFTTRPEGTGLGLPLARRIVEAHGGRLALDSAPGEGTVVAAWLPLEPEGHVDGNEAEPPDRCDE